MPKRILVPLDETTDPPDNVVTEHGQVVAYMDQEAARLRVQWLDYLRTVDGLLLDVDLEREVRFGNPLQDTAA